MVWLTGGMFAIACLMILSLLALVLYQGLATLWPRRFLVLSTSSESLAAGELQNWQTYRLSRQNLGDLDPASQARAETLLGESGQVDATQMYLRTGNYEVTNRHFMFVPELSITSTQPMEPKNIWLLERREWGNLYGFPAALSWMQATEEGVTDTVRGAQQQAAKLAFEIDQQKQLLEHLDRGLTAARLRLRQVELAEKSDLQVAAEQAVQEAFMKSSQESGAPVVPATEGASSLALSEAAQRAIDGLVRESLMASEEQVAINEAIAKLEAERDERSIIMQLPILDSEQVIDVPYTDLVATNAVAPALLTDVLGYSDVTAPIAITARSLNERQALLELRWLDQPPRMVWASAEDSGRTSIGKLKEHRVLIADIVRLVEPNRLSWFGKCGVYASRWVEFLFGQPREAGVEGGFFPAIWGTIVMTLVMSLAVMPFGVLAALYMREYASNGWLLSAIRISINNLAGVPSIVYGVFGLSFFCYTLGGYIDGGPVKAGFVPWPSAVWFSALAILAVVGLAAFAVSLLGSQVGQRGGRLRKLIGFASGLFWLASVVGIGILLAKSPFFHGFYEAQLPNPTFGKGCLLWAACTLALLTLPVVIVATEEALAAVPNSLREGSYACGAGKWQTIHRIVLPYARPGIITGFILAMARGAGEVAPMMLVGAIPLATDLPLDTEFPFLHGSRSFMHLGFQIYSLGFQSQNSEAAKPMVFTVTLLLITIVTLLNQTAIWLRARLRKRFQSAQF
jgi:phosphate transport system permease protein